MVAASMFHETMHLMQVRHQGLGGASDCVYMEAQAFVSGHVLGIVLG